MGKNKSAPKIGVTVPAEGRSPRHTQDPQSFQARQPVWRVRRADMAGEFSFAGISGAQLRDLHDRLGNLETMTWAQIPSTGSHPIPISDLSKEAQARLRELRIDDVDELYSLRLAGRPRCWGIRRGEVLELLWWDPEHRVCPSHKKHT